jgi:hypothetical protein
MRIDGVNPGLPVAGEATPSAGLAVRLLAGNLPDVSVGQQVAATVLGNQGSATLLNVQGHPVLVAGLPRVPAGTEVAVTLQGLGPNAVLEGAPGPSLTATPLPLAVGQEVVAHVLQQLPDGHVLINVNGVPLDAAAPPGLRPGAEVALRVAEVQPQVVFHIVENAPSVEAQAAQVVRANLADGAPAAQSLAAVRQAIAALLAPENVEPPPVSVARLQTVLDRLLPEQSPPSAERIAAFVRDGGLLLEAKLARAGPDGAAAGRVIDGDVKGLVLKALGDLPAATTTAQAEGLTAALAQHLGGIEAQQALNLLALLHGEAIQLQIPFYAGQQLTTAFLSVEPDGSAGDDAEGRRAGYDVLFLLDLDRLGRTRIDAHFSGNAMRVVFYVEGAESLRRVRAELPAFGRALQAMGYADVLLAAAPLGEMAPERRQKVEALALGVPAGVRLVDVRA